MTCGYRTRVLVRAIIPKTRGKKTKKKNINIYTQQNAMHLVMCGLKHKNIPEPTAPSAPSSVTSR